MIGCTNVGTIGMDRHALSVEQAVEVAVGPIKEGPEVLHIVEVEPGPAPRATGTVAGGPGSGRVVRCCGTCLGPC